MEDGNDSITITFNRNSNESHEVIDHIAESIEESLQRYKEDALDAKLQIELKDKEIKEERLKLYAACIGLAGIFVTSAVTIITLVVSQGCN